MTICSLAMAYAFKMHLKMHALHYNCYMSFNKSTVMKIWATYQEFFQWFLVGFGVFALYFCGSESVLDVEGARVEPAPLVSVGMIGHDPVASNGDTATAASAVDLLNVTATTTIDVRGRRSARCHLRPDGQSVGVESGFSAGPDLLVDNLG